MLEINNNFLLVGLIIVAVTCIYLVYLNLSKSSEITSLKTSINSLIQQNKKRDEITTFLLDRVETLTAAINNTNSPLLGEQPQQLPPQQQTPTPDVIFQTMNATTIHPEEADFDSREIDELLAAEDEQQPAVSDEVHPQVEQAVMMNATEESDEVDITEITLGDKSSSEPVVDKSSSEPVVDKSSSEPVVDSIPAAQAVELPVQEASNAQAVDESVPVVAEAQAAVPKLTAESLDELIKDSEFSNMNFSFITKKHQAEELDTVSEVELDTSIDYTNIPKDKKSITQQYTAKQLKSIARHFGVKSRGTKTELVNRIYEVLSKQSVDQTAA